MALIHCPECGEEISSFADVCIHCGFPIGRQKQEREFDDDNICLIDGKEFDLSEFKEYIIDLSNTIGYVSDEEKEKLTNTLHEYCDHVSKEFVRRLIQIMIDTKAVPQKHESFSYRKGLQWEEERKQNAAIRKHREEETRHLLHCPKCNSTNISTGSRGYSMMWGFIGSGKTVNRCGSCGHKWEPRG